MVYNDQKLVGAGEELYRRPKRRWVHKFDEGLGRLLVRDEAFMPRPADLNGMSLFRANKVEPSCAASAGLQGGGKIGLGSIASDAFVELELDVVADDEPEGHASIPAIEPNADPEDLGTWAIALAEKCVVRSWHRLPGGEEIEMPEFGA